MSLRLLTCLLCVCVLFATTQSTAAEENVRPKIIWAKQNLVPFYIMDGPFAGQGISDRLQAFLSKNLPDYDHVLREMSFDRVLDQANQGYLVCSALILKTDRREQFLIYSQPVKPGYDHLFITTGEVNLIDGFVDLEAFIEGHDHPIVAQNGRSYGPHIDRILWRGKQAKKVSFNQTTTDQLYKMVAERKHGHFIDVESSLTYYRALGGRAAEKLRALPIKGIESGRFGYAACSRNELGEKAVAQINQLLTDQADSAELRYILESWIAPENLERYRQKYEMTILEARR